MASEKERKDCKRTDPKFYENITKKLNSKSQKCECYECAHMGHENCGCCK